MRGLKVRWTGAGIFAIAAVLLLMPAGAGAQHSATHIAAKGGALLAHGAAATNQPRLATALVGKTLADRTLPNHVTTSGGSSSLATASTLSPVSTSKFAGLTQAKSGGQPFASPGIAQSGAYVFEVVDSRAKITSVTGTTVYQSFTLQSMWGLPKGDNVVQSQVVYDNLAKRWIVTALDYSTNLVYTAVSSNSSPLSSYHTYGFSTFFSGFGPEFMDLPQLGLSKTFVAIGVDIFNGTSDAFVGSILVVFGETKFVAGTFSPSPIGTGYFGLTPARATSTNGTGTDILYAATTEGAGGSTTLAVLEVSGKVGSTLAASFVYYTIANTGSVPLGDQPGAPSSLEIYYDRVTSAAWFQGHLWVAYSTACTPSGDATTRSCIRVDAIATLTNTLDQDTDTAVAGVDLFYGALTPLTSGVGYLMVLDYSSSLDYPSIAVSGQNSTDTYGTFRGPTPVLSGTGATGYEYGLYAGCQIQFTGAKQTAWAAAEYYTATGWSTEVVHFSFY